MDEMDRSVGPEMPPVSINFRPFRPFQSVFLLRMYDLLFLLGSRFLPNLDPAVCLLVRNDNLYHEAISTFPLPMRFAMTFMRPWDLRQNQDRVKYRRQAYAPQVSGLESRQVLSAASIHAAAVVRPLIDLNSQVVSFAKSHLHMKVGGGECAHLANAALRVAGADFFSHDPLKNGDYTWGSLVTTITPGKDSSASAKCLPGDIIQFQNVNISGGWSAAHHTAIVAAVDKAGRPTQVYEQNVGVNGKGKGGGSHDRTDRLDPLALNSKTITAGTVHIYRPVPRVDAPGKVQFSIVNSTTAPQVVTEYYNGKDLGTISLDTFNTAGSYMLGYVTGTGTITWTIGLNGKSVPLSNASGYEVYYANGSTTIRMV